MAKKKAKKGIDLSVILKGVAVLCGVVAFIMMFLPQVFTNGSFFGFSGETKHGMETFFGNDDGLKGYVLPFVGYILIIVGAALPVVSAFLIKDKKMDALLVAVAGVLLIAGAIMVITVLNGFADANGFSNADIGGLGVITATVGMLAAPIVAFICALIAGLADLAAVILPKVMKK